MKDGMQSLAIALAASQTREHALRRAAAKATRQIRANTFSEI